MDPMILLGLLGMGGGAASNVANTALGAVPMVISLFDRFRAATDPTMHRLGGIIRGRYNQSVEENPYGDVYGSWGGAFGQNDAGNPIGVGEAQARAIMGMMGQNPASSTIANYQQLAGAQRPEVTNSAAGLQSLMGQAPAQSTYRQPQLQLQTPDQSVVNRTNFEGSPAPRDTTSQQLYPRIGRLSGRLGSAGSNLRSYEQGTPYVPKTGPAQLHKGEAVIPASRNPVANGGGGRPISDSAFVAAGAIGDIVSSLLQNGNIIGGNSRTPFGNYMARPASGTNLPRTIAANQQAIQDAASAPPAPRPIIDYTPIVTPPANSAYATQNQPAPGTITDMKPVYGPRPPQPAPELTRWVPFTGPNGENMRTDPFARPDPAAYTGAPLTGAAPSGPIAAINGTPSGGGAAGTSGLEALLALLQQANPANGGGKMPSFAVGTSFVPQDMTAKIHQGEAIIPAAQNPFAKAPNAWGGGGQGKLPGAFLGGQGGGGMSGGMNSQGGGISGGMNNQGGGGGGGNGAPQSPQSLMQMLIGQGGQAITPEMLQRMNTASTDRLQNEYGAMQRNAYNQNAMMGGVGGNVDQTGMNMFLAGQGNQVQNQNAITAANTNWQSLLQGAGLQLSGEQAAAQQGLAQQQFEQGLYGQDISQWANIINAMNAAGQQSQGNQMGNWQQLMGLTQGGINQSTPFLNSLMGQAAWRINPSGQYPQQQASYGMPSGGGGGGNSFGNALGYWGSQGFPGMQ